MPNGEVRAEAGRKPGRRGWSGGLALSLNHEGHHHLRSTPSIKLKPKQAKAQGQARKTILKRTA
eukprot:7057695-Prymnesium_polylepis.2